MDVTEGDGEGLAAVLPLDGSQAPSQDDGRGDRLDENDPRPLWRQLADLLRGRIDRGELAGRLEAEMTLAEHYGVSRDTVRRSLAELARDGLIQSTRGRGTFVVPPEHRGTLPAVVSCAGEARCPGRGTWPRPRPALRNRNQTSSYN